MGVRAVAAVAALAVWCMSGAAVAAGYVEVWNPPEASGHVAKQARKKGGSAEIKSTAGSKVASKSASKHVAGAQHAAPRVASTAGHSNKPVAQGSVKKVAVKATTKSGINATGASKAPSKTAVMAQSKKPHAQRVQTKPAQGKVVRANLVVPARQAHPQSATVAAKPAATHVNVPAPSANVSANPANATSNPATASSGSLPPILH
ncbi:hypothetical protein RI103_31990 [Paraburkholderia sp. FT54]|uniref:hypothetical protein n=1 Tax=Paraburkholderia sp. FT54 TaxID=3074437 RepID=UPI002877E57D|nr:hypothetical protein [Paraburkholderia sp. FT54]WNC92835.1 hypothetical protein RI103_31990 [Paraburkholderia sp. FT54]